MNAVDAEVVRASLDDPFSQFESPELEEQIARTCASTTKLVRDGADKDDLREAFAELAILKSRRNSIDIFRIECLMNLGGIQ